MKRWCATVAVLFLGAALALPLAGSAEEQDESCEIDCYEAEEACDVRCEQEGDDDTCGDRCEAAFDRCMEKCEQRSSEER